MRAVHTAAELSRQQARVNVEQQQPRVFRARAQARPVDAQPAAPMPQVPAHASPAPNLMGAPAPVPMGQSPFRIPDGRGMGGGSIMRQRSVFDETVRGQGAQVQQLKLLGSPGPILQDAPVPTASMGQIPQRRPSPAAAPRQAMMGPNLWMGQSDAAAPPPVQPSAVERVVQREMPSSGFSTQEAGALADALDDALRASADAVANEVSCGNVDALIVQEVRVMQAALRRFAAAAAPAARFDDLSAEDLRKIDAVLACESTYDEVSGARNAKTAAIVVGGIVVGGIILSILT